MSASPSPHPSQNRGDSALRLSRRYRTERYYRDGSVMIWPVQLAVLQGLLDRPRGVAMSQDDCIRAATPYGAAIRGSEPTTGIIRCAIRQAMRRGWVRKRRVGRRNRFEITARGRQLLDGTVVTRVMGGWFYNPGWPSARVAESGTVVMLDGGVQLVVPPTWTANQPRVAEALASGAPIVNGSPAARPKHGFQLIVRPAAGPGIPMVALMLAPAAEGQGACAWWGDEALAALDSSYHSQAAAAAARAGYTVTAWHGTTRATVGRRPGLVTGYAVRRNDGLEKRKEVHVAVVGNREFVVHVYLPVERDTPVERETRAMLASLRITADQL